MADDATIKLKGDNDPLKQSLNESRNMFTEWGVAIKTNVVALGIELAQSLKNNLRDLLVTAIAESAEGELEFALLDVRLKSLGSTASRTRDDIEELAVSLQRASTFGAGDFVKAQTEMLRFGNISADIFERAIKLSTDWASATRTDVVSTSQTVARALNAPEQGLRLLRQAGISFSEAQELVFTRMGENNDIIGQQTMLLVELEKRYGGAAKTVGETYTGATESLTESLKDLAASIGDTFLPKLSEMIKQLRGVVDDINAINAGKSDGQGMGRWSNLMRWANDPFGLAGSEDEQRAEKLQDDLLVMQHELKKVREARDTGRRREDSELADSTFDWKGFFADLDAREAKIIEDINKRIAEDRKAAEPKKPTAVSPEVAKEAEKSAQERAKIDAEVAKAEAELRAKKQQEEYEKLKKTLAPFGKLGTVGQGIDFQKLFGVKFGEDKGFQSNIEDAMGLSRRIASTAASLSPESKRLDEIIKQGKEREKTIKDVGAAIVAPIKALAEKTVGAVFQ